MAIAVFAAEAAGDDCDLDADAHKKCPELCFASGMAKVVFGELRFMTEVLSKVETSMTSRYVCEHI
eukprot:893820-Pyramimonas_sp.AAC.1